MLNSQKKNFFLLRLFCSFCFVFFLHFDFIQASSCLTNNSCVQLEDTAEWDDCDGTFYEDSEVCGSCWIDNQCDVEDYGQSSCLAQNGLWASTTDCDGREAAALQGQTDLTTVVACLFPVSSNTQYTSLNNYGSAQNGGSSCHPGTDINLTGSNQEIIAATAGTVYNIINNFSTCPVTSSSLGGQSSAVIIEDDGIFYLYGGLDPSSFSFQSGDSIIAGQLLGTSKNCGQLHFEVRSDSDFSQFWHPPSGETIGDSSDYCVSHFSPTKPVNLINSTTILRNFSQSNCLVISSNSADYSAGEGFINPVNESAFVKNNAFTAKKYDLNKFIAHLIYDGNQAYCAASSTSVISGFTHSKYKSMKLDLKEATIPLMRNDNYQPARRNSAETYYGYIADTQNKNITSENDLLVESSWLGKTLTNETRCTMKVYNLLYLRTEYNKCLSETLQICLPINQTEAKTAKQKKCVALGEERCEKIHLTMSSGFSTKNLIQDLTDKKVALLPNLELDTSSSSQEGEEPNYVLDETGEEISAKTYCQTLSQFDTEQNQIIKDGYNKFPLYLANLYRTGYIVQAVKICPVRKTGDCSNPVWDYDNCSWSIIPDRIRVYPFKFPDFATNKNYCDQTSEEYPDNCEVNPNLPSFDPTTNYSDPATLNAQFLQTFNEQKTDRTNSVAARSQMISLAQSSTYESGDFVYCYNCKTTLAQALIKIINATNSNNTFNLSYLGEKAGSMDCSGGITTGETSSQITTSALHSLKKEGITAYEAPVAGGAGSFKESCCLERETVIGEDGLPYEICVSTAYAKAKVRYWIVAPQGEQLKMIEEQILGTFYRTRTTSNKNATQAEQSIDGTYNAFIEGDKRQNKYLSLQNIITKSDTAPSLNILGAGPITNIFIVQQSLYTKNSGLYQTLAKYKDINAYLTDVFNTGSSSIYTACGEITPISDPLHDAYLKSILPTAYYNIMMTPVENLTDSMLEAACPSASGRVYSSKANAGKMVRYYDNGPLWSSKTKTPTYGNNSQISRKKIEDCIYTIFDDPKLVINMTDCESFTIANNVGFGSNSHGCYAAGLLQIKPFKETQMSSNYNNECSNYSNYPSLSSLSCNTQASIARLNLPLYNLAIAKAIATNNGSRSELFNSWGCYWHVINGTSGTII